MERRVVAMQAKVLNVFMNGRHVGQLTKSASRRLAWTYEDAWCDLAGARPISLSLPLAQRKLDSECVYHFFDNLLPDSPLMRARIRDLFHLPTDEPFDLLAGIGKECVGALQIVENREPLPDTFLYQPLTEKESAAILRNTGAYPLGMSTYADDFRLSLAGVQEKAAFLYWKGQWNRPRGQTPTTHIFKPPIGDIQHQNMDLSDSCENEWLCSCIASAFGLPVAPSEIQYFEDVKVLIVERFDRKCSEDGSRIIRLPQEDLCQALGLSRHLKYQADGGPDIETIMRLLLGSACSHHDRDLFFRTQVLFWLLAAIDGHAKNFSLFLEAGGKYRLTPLYDILSVHPLMASGQLHIKKIKMAMALHGKNNHYHWDDMQHRRFIETAKAVHYSVQSASRILEEMLAKVDVVIERVSSKLPQTFPHRIAEPIFEGMREAKRRLLL